MKDRRVFDFDYSNMSSSTLANIAAVVFLSYVSDLSSVRTGCCC